MPYSIYSPDRYCSAHGKYLCKKCRANDDKQTDWGIFEWRDDGIYTRGTAIKIYKSRKLAENAARKAEGNIVARWISRSGRE